MGAERTQVQVDPVVPASGVALGAVLFVAGFGIVLSATPGRYRGTFYEHDTLSNYCRLRSWRCHSHTAMQCPSTHPLAWTAF